MTDFVRTADEHFAGLPGFPYEPQYHLWRDLRVHYVDEGLRDAPVMLLLHGMPTWSYLYRTMIPPLVAAGYRCVAPDHLGFGRSDKPTDPNWYTIARHTEVLTSLVTALDLRNITLVCQDWGGPIGLAQAAMMPERFDQLVVMNTWLHHDGYHYSDAIRNWNRQWHEGGLFHRERPDVALIPLYSAGLIGPEVLVPALTDGVPPVLEGDAADMYRGFAAPYQGLPDEGFNGYRRFPHSIPLDEPDSGNAVAQAHFHRVLLDSELPAHFVWGGDDEVFTESWGREWAFAMGATFDLLPGANHFLQNTHGPEIVDLILRRAHVV